MQILFVSLGCDKNLVDTEMMLGQLAEKGYTFTDDEAEADIAVVNSCCFIGDAKEESINTILQLAELKTEGQLKALIVCGCLAQRYKDEIQTEIPEVDAIIGTTAIDTIVETVDSVLAGKSENHLEDIDRACVYGVPRSVTTGGHFAYLKIAEGCNKRCTYCVIPSVRGNYRSIPMDSLVREAKKLVENGAVVGVEAETGEVFEAKCVILATGTYLRGRIVYGQVNYECGPNGLRSAQKLSASLLENGVELMRFKTGTPARIDARSLDYSKMEPQYGDEEVRNFSFISDIKTREQVPCYLTYTNEATHKIIRDNLHLSGMYNGMIEGVGPRYCPSIESKIVRFANKERHQLFIEPEGRSTNEMYVQGMSSSLPAHIQLQFMQTIPGLEHCKMMRAGYAIDYDCLDPLQLRPSLEHKAISGLFSAGQSNGTSGYEEAAAQGLMAGINAMMKINGREPLVLRRDEAYIGVLIDDLVTKGTSEPYRMMTSRAEYRLLLRQDNADLRLTEKGRAIGLVDDKRYGIFTEKRTALERTVSELGKQNISPSAENNAKLEAMGTAPLRSGSSLLDLLRRKEVTYSKLQQAFGLSELAPQVAEQAEIFAKYEGYITKQRQEVERFMKLENKRLPDDIDYRAIKELSSEAAEKLDKVRPANIGQASRISGVAPADIGVLIIALELKRRKEQEE